MAVGIRLAGALELEIYFCGQTTLCVRTIHIQKADAIFCTFVNIHLCNALLSARDYALGG